MIGSCACLWLVAFLFATQAQLSITENEQLLVKLFSFTGDSKDVSTLRFYQGSGCGAHNFAPPITKERLTIESS